MILDLDIGLEAVTIKRNRKQADKPIIIREGKTVSFDKIQDARDYLAGIIFSKLNELEDELQKLEDAIESFDILVQCLNYLYKQEEQYQNFQYILTLNRDKIESEEQRKLIQMNIDEHQVAAFTKEKKFLERDYQEK